MAVRIASKCPAIYSLNLDQNVIPTIDFLSKVWGMNNETTGFSKKKSNKNEFIPMLHEYPNIITLSVETNLQPTMMFFNKTGYTLLNENWELISSSTSSSSSSSNNIGGSSSAQIGNNINGKHTTPSRIRGRYIAASLYNRLLPRWHFCFSSNTEDSKVHSEKNTESATAANSSTAIRTSASASTSTAKSSSTSSPSSPKTPSLHLLVMASDDAFCKAMGSQLETYMKFRKEAIPRLKFSSQFDTWLKTGKPIDL